MSTGLAFLGINVLFESFLEPRMMGYGVGIATLIGSESDAGYELAQRLLDEDEDQ